MYCFALLGIGIEDCRLCGGSDGRDSCRLVIQITVLRPISTSENTQSVGSRESRSSQIPCRVAKGSSTSDDGPQSRAAVASLQFRFLECCRFANVRHEPWPVGRTYQ